MQLVLVRHGIAEERRPGAADAARRLTPDGRRRMRRAARGLGRLLSTVDLLASSPLPRAAETAALLADEVGPRRRVELPELSPGSSPEAVLAWLRSRARGTVVLVGHEPDLSRLAALVVTGSPEPLFRLKKGGATLVRVAGPLRPGTGQLGWLLGAGALRALGEAARP